VRILPSMDLIELAVVTRDIEREFSSFVMIRKEDSWLMRLINVVFFILTFGQMKAFMTSFTTTLGTAVYTPKQWDTFSPMSKAVILRHERVHMRQARKHTWLWFSFLYLFAFFPVGLAWYRAKFEMEAYAETLRAYHEYGVDIQRGDIKARMLQHFTTAQYLWMFPFSGYLSRWFDETVAEILRTVKVRGAP